MNPSFLISASCMLVGGVFFIAANSIALECGNENPGYYNDKRKDHKIFLIVTLVIAILLTLMSFPGFYVGAVA
jgi:hypothetical protein